MRARGHRVALLLTVAWAALAVVPAAAAANQPPTVGPITARAEPPTTLYSVAATDPDGDALTYTWTAEIPCGTFTQTGIKARWNYPAGDPPGGCPVPPGTRGTIHVSVSDGQGHTVERVYQGSQTGTGIVPTPTPTLTPSTAPSSTSPPPVSSPSPTGIAVSPSGGNPSPSAALTPSAGTGSPSGGTTPTASELTPGSPTATVETTPTGIAATPTGGTGGDGQGPIVVISIVLLTALICTWWWWFWHTRCPPWKKARQRKLCTQWSLEAEIEVAKLREQGGKMRDAARDLNAEVADFQRDVTSWEKDLATYTRDEVDFANSLPPGPPPPYGTATQYAVQKVLTDRAADLTTQRADLTTRLNNLTKKQADLAAKQDAYDQAVQDLIDKLKDRLRRLSCVTCNRLGEMLESAQHMPKMLPLDPPTGPLGTPGVPAQPPPLPPVVPPGPEGGEVEAGPLATTDRTCPCSFTNSEGDRSWLEIELLELPPEACAQVGPVGDEPVYVADAGLPVIALSANAAKGRLLNVTADDGAGMGGSLDLTVPSERFNCSWRVDKVEVTDPPDGGGLKPVLRIAGSRTGVERDATVGATVEGGEVLLTLPIADLYVDWVTGTAPQQTLEGKLADLRIVLTTTAKSGQSTETKTATLTLTGTTSIGTPASDCYQVSLEVDPPTAPEDVRPTLMMRFVDAHARRALCEPVAAYRVGKLTLEATSPTTLEMTSGDLHPLELDSLLEAVWSVIPEDPACGNAVIAQIAQHSRAMVRWAIKPSGSTVPPLELSQCGPDACWLYARETTEERKVEVTATVSMEEYIDASGHGPLITKTVSFFITVQPRRLRLRLEDTQHKPLANCKYVLTPSGGKAVNGTTGADGVIDAPIPPRLATAKLEVFSDDDPNDPSPVCVFDLTVGDLFGVTSHTGARSRLNNWGLSPGAEGKTWDQARITRSLQRFQSEQKLQTTHDIDKPNVSGEEDDATRDKMRELDDR